MYDQNGNRIKEDVPVDRQAELGFASRRYVYDYANRLVKIEYLDGANSVIRSIEYGYDVFNRQVRKRVSEAAQWFTKAAEQNHAEAQFNLGSMYYFGDGVSKDLKTASTWFKRAADQGHSDAQFNLAIMYLKGEGVPADLAESVTWLRRAADQGDATAQFNLAMLFSSGRGVTKDLVQAVMWADLASAAGEPNSRRLLANLEKTARPDEIAEAVRKEHEWKPNVQYSWSIK